ncbi:MAG: AraC family transcriptional regulator [Gorillibacterium sp.]|nr:AraC family transcriptional regulator [Gorillibacterium sp.]
MQNSEFDRDSDFDSLNRLDSLTVCLQDIEKLKAGADGRLPQRLTLSYQLIVITQGEGLLTLDSKTCRIRAQEIYCCTPGQTFGIMERAEAELEITLIHFDLFRESRTSKGWLQQVKDEVLFDSSLGLGTDSAVKLILMCDNIFNHWHSGKALGRFRSQLDFQELLFTIAKNNTEALDDSYTMLQRTKTFMDEHYPEDLTLNQLAAMTGLSRNYFVDLFKKQYHISAMDYITQLRIDRAKQFMAGAELRLRDIAHQVGYNDEFYFSRKFKKEVGVSPSLYMKSRRRRIVAYNASVIGQLIALGPSRLNSPDAIRDEGNWKHQGWSHRFTSEAEMDTFVDDLAQAQNAVLRARLGAALYTERVLTDPWNALLARAEMHLSQAALLDAAAQIAESGDDTNPAPFLVTGAQLRSLADRRRRLAEEIVASSRTANRPGPGSPLFQSSPGAGPFRSRFDPQEGLSEA